MRGGPWHGMPYLRGLLPGLPGRGDYPPFKLGSLSTPPLCPATPSSCIKAWLHSASSLKPAMLPPPPTPSLARALSSEARGSLPRFPQLSPPLHKCNTLTLAFYTSGQSSKVTLSGASWTTPCASLVGLSLSLSPGPQVCSFRRRTSVGGAGSLLKVERPAL